MRKIIFLLFVILLVPVFSVGAENVPEWVKNIAKWYGEDKIPETDFLNAIKFLIENEIIVLEPITDLSNTTMTVPGSAVVVIPNGNAQTSPEGFFQPLNLEVNINTTVEWINEDNFGHTVQSIDEYGKIIPLFNSPVLETGDKFTHLFDESGIHNYYCTLHPWRVGVITVR